MGTTLAHLTPQQELERPQAAVSKWVAAHTWEEPSRRAAVYGSMGVAASSSNLREMRLANQAGSPGSSASLPGTLEAQLAQSKPPARAEEIRWRLVLARHAGGAIGQIPNVREQLEHVRGNDEVEMRGVLSEGSCARTAVVIANTNGSSASS